MLRATGARGTVKSRSVQPVPPAEVWSALRVTELVEIHRRSPSAGTRGRGEGFDLAPAPALRPYVLVCPRPCLFDWTLEL